MLPPEPVLPSPTAAPDLPTEIKRLTTEENPITGFGLSVTFQSGKEITLSSRALREGCPCASCLESRGDRTHQQPLSGPGRSLLRVIKSTSEQELDLQKVWPVGNYAVGIRWGDGHDSGIFTYQQLLQLAATNSDQ